MSTDIRSFDLLQAANSGAISEQQLLDLALEHKQAELHMDMFFELQSMGFQHYAPLKEGEVERLTALRTFFRGLKEAGVDLTNTQRSVSVGPLVARPLTP